MSSRVVRVVLVSMLATASAVWAQAPQGGGRGGRGGAGQTVEKIRQLKPDLHLITGGGANTLVRVTPGGLIVVDTKNPGDENYNRLMESAIPGRGEPKTRAEVQAYRDRFASLVSRATDAIKAGATRDQLATQVKTDDLGWQFNPQFFGQLHDELTRK